MPKKSENKVSGNRSTQPTKKILNSAPQDKALPNQPKDGFVNGILKILRDGAWQGCGTIVGIASLIVTIVLTIYIFEFTQNQEIAQASTRMIFSQIDENSWKVRLQVFNYGPAVANNVEVTIFDETKEREIEFSSFPQKAEDIFEINPSQSEVYDYGVIARYEKIIPDQLGVIYFTVKFPPSVNKLFSENITFGLPTDEMEKQNFNFIQGNILKVSIDGINLDNSGVKVVVSKY